MVDMSASCYYATVRIQANGTGLLAIKKIRAKGIDIVGLEVYCSFYWTCLLLCPLTPLAKVPGNYQANAEPNGNCHTDYDEYFSDIHAATAA